MALIRRLAQKRPSFTVKVVFFDAEEPGVFVESLGRGSTKYVNSILANDEASSVKLSIIVDMIGGPPTEPDLGLILAINPQVDQEMCEATVKRVKTNS